MKLDKHLKRIHEAKTQPLTTTYTISDPAGDGEAVMKQVENGLNKTVMTVGRRSYKWNDHKLKNKHYGKITYLFEFQVVDKNSMTQLDSSLWEWKPIKTTNKKVDYGFFVDGKQYHNVSDVVTYYKKIAEQAKV